jgi:hypothetical protein
MLGFCVFWLAISSAGIAAADGPPLIADVAYPPAAAPAPAAPRPQVTAATAAVPPTLDGLFDDACWQAGKWQQGFLLNDGSGRLAEAQTAFQVAHDAATIYVAVQCLEPEMAQLKDFWGAKHDESVFNDDCVELWFDVDNRHQKSYHVILSNAGGRLDAIDTQRVVDDPKAATVGVKQTLQDSDLTWDTQTQSACYKAADHWTLEARIPVADFGLEEIVPGATWGFNVGRERWAAGPEFSSLTGVFQFPLEQYAELHFGQPRLTVTVHGAEALGRGDHRITLSLRNPTPEHQRYTFHLTAASEETQEESRTVELDPRAGRRETFLCRFTGVGDYRLLLAATDAAGQKVFRQEFMTLHERALDFSWRSRNYYCGEAATANLSLHLGPVTQARTRLRVAVLDEGGRVVAADQVRRLRATSLRLRLNLGTLPEPGYYRLRLTLVDQAGQEWAREDVPFRVIAPPAFAPAGS